MHKFSPLAESRNSWLRTERLELWPGLFLLSLVSPIPHCPLIFFQMSHISMGRLGKCHSAQEPQYFRVKSFCREPRRNSAGCVTVAHSYAQFGPSGSLLKVLGIILTSASLHYMWWVLSGSGSLHWLLFVKSNKRLSNDHSATTKRIQGIGTVRTRY